MRLVDFFSRSIPWYTFGTGRLYSVTHFFCNQGGKAGAKHGCLNERHCLRNTAQVLLHSAQGSAFVIDKIKA